MQTKKMSNMTPEQRSEYMRQLSHQRKNRVGGFKDPEKARAAALKSAEVRRNNAGKALQKG